MSTKNFSSWNENILMQTSASEDRAESDRSINGF